MTYHAALGRHSPQTIRPGAKTAEAMARLPMRVEVVSSIDRFLALAPEWDALAATQETPLALHSWYAAALETQREAAPKIRVPLVWRGEVLVGAAPLKYALSGPRRLVPIDAFTGEPDRVLYQDTEALRALGKACAQLREPVLFRRFAAPVEDAREFCRALRRGAGGMLMKRHRQSYLHLPEDISAFEESMQTSKHRRIRRKLNMIKRAGGHELTVLTPREEEVETLLERFAKIEDAGWKGRAGTSLIGDAKMARFVSLVARSFARTGDAVVTFLTIDGRDASSRVILQHGHSWCGIKIGYDEEFKRFSPGIILMHETFGRAIARGITSYRFLGVSEDWQNYWPHERRFDYRLATYPLSLRSIGALWDDGVRGLRSLLRRG